MSHANRPFRLASLVSALLCLSLAACGGGGDDNTPTSPTGGNGTPSSGNNGTPSGGGNTTTTGPVSQPTLATRFNGPAGLTVDATGNIYVADQGNCRIRKVTSAGVVSTVISNTAFANCTSAPPHAIAFDPTDATGNTFWVAGGDTVSKGTLTTPTALNDILGSTNLHSATGIVVGQDGTIYVANDNGDGTGTIVIGQQSGKIVTLTGLTGPQGITRDASGALYVTDVATDGTTLVKKITVPDLATIADHGSAAVTATTFAGPFTGKGAGITVDATGNVAFVQPTSITLISSAGAKTTVPVDPTVLKALTGIAFDANGQLDVSDFVNDTISTVVPTTGAFTTIAGMAGQSGAVDSAP